MQNRPHKVTKSHQGIGTNLGERSLVCFYIAKRTDSFAKYLALKQNNTYLFLFCLCIVIFAILCSTYPEFKGVFLLTFLAQYLLCLMLAFSYSRKYSNNTR